MSSRSDHGVDERSHEGHLPENAYSETQLEGLPNQSMLLDSSMFKQRKQKSLHHRNSSLHSNRSSLYDNSKQSIPAPDDFVSFPTIPDPENDDSKTLTKIFTKTLRKVTNNASNLVQSYSGVKNLPTTQMNDMEHEAVEDSSNPVNQPLMETTAVVPKELNINSRVSTNNSFSSAPQKQQPAGLNISSVLDTGQNSIRSFESHEKSLSIHASIDALHRSTPSKLDSVTNQNLPNTSLALSSNDIKRNQHPVQSESLFKDAGSSEKHFQPINPANVDDTPRVTSDGSGLRLSGMKLPKLQSNSFNGNATSSVVNVNALASTDRTNILLSNKDNREILNKPSSLQQVNDSKERKSLRPHQLLQLFTPEKDIEQTDSKGQTLQSKISSIFNNLPNDIELSDDSASDLETINNSSSLSSPTHRNLNNKQSDGSILTINTDDSDKQNHAKMTSSTHAANAIFQSTYSEPTSIPSPIKVERGRGSNDATLNSSNMSPTLSTFYALRNKEGQYNSNLMKKKPSNLSSVLFDNAKSILHNNITGAVSSASSIVTAKGKRKKKKKPKRLSENPLKNGGIPRKYWMNDAFISDCLNCFRPFSAFRRKHHCRFCGQIYCSDCTLFISYNQHKQERKLKVSDKTNGERNSNSYNDKLRVCKPCYDDVIVYLSDDSSSSSENADSEIDLEEVFEDDGEDYQPGFNNNPTPYYGEIPDHPLSRIRSLSINSRRGSLLNESALAAANKSFLDKDSSLTPTSPTNQEYPPNSFSTPSKHLQPGVPSYVNNSSILLSGYSSLNNSEAAKSSPKHPPQMAIPTTRKGEAVEIPVSKTSSNNVANNNKNNLTLLAINNASNHNTSPGSLPNNSDHMESPSYLSNSLSKPWFRSYNHGKTSNSGLKMDLPRSNSLDNFSSLYNNFIGKRAPRFGRIHSNSDKDFTTLKSKRSDLILSQDDVEDGSETEIEGGDDLESENEDDKVMSLYTSLNNPDPRPATLTSTSASVVPTLNEFPTIGVEKRFPKNFNVPRAAPGVSFLDDRPKSESKSNERAHASLMRMQSRRKSRSVRNILILSHNNYKLQNIDNSNTLNSPSPVSTPSSPTPHQPIHSNLTKGLSSDSVGNNVPSLRASSSSGHIGHSTDVSFANTTSLGDPMTPKISTTDVDHDISQDITAQLNSQDIDEIESPHNHDTIFGDGAEISIDSQPISTEKRYDNLIDQILVQCLEDCDIVNDQERWKQSLKKVLSNVNILKVTDTLDIKQYIKIKKILGGKIEDTSIIDGLFMTKNIDSKRMLSKVENPRIALLMFPIEYLKLKEQFISLRIVHSQQDVYITNLVSRLISLEPDVVVVGDTVCGLAEKLLEDANITVISNVKPQVIERISRYTRADIFQSINDLFFKKGVLGSCKLFEVRKYIFQNTIKTYTFFTGNDIESGFTIGLRGGDHDLLESIKYAVETLISAQLNAKLERSLLYDHGVTIMESDFNPVLALSNHLEEIRLDQENEIDDTLTSCNNALDNHEIENYIKLFNERKLSTSPAVKFSLPTSLLNVVDFYDKFYRFYKINKRIQSSQTCEGIDTEIFDELKINIDINKLPNGEHDLITMLKYVSDYNLRSLVHEFQSRIRIWSNCMKFTSYQLYPIFHKKIHFLHSTVSIKHATPCAGPNIIVIDYYTENDKCFGVYLDQIFHESSKTCDECGESLINHYKTYVHGNRKIDLIIEKYDDLSYEQNFKGKNQRVMWSSCKHCDFSSSIVTMNDSTYYLSIGKFFEMCFWGSDGTIENKACPHDFFRDHVRYYAFNDLVIRIEFSYIDNYEVVVPRKKLEFVPEIDIKLKVDAFNNIKSKSESFFQSISKRLNRVKVDTFDKAEDGIKKVEELKLKLDQQTHSIREKTINIYNSTSPIIYLSLNSILRELQELGVEWDNEFSEFEKNFLPTENEITRITQFHLKNFLLDKYNSEGQTKEVEMNDMSKHKKNSIQSQESDSQDVSTIASKTTLESEKEKPIKYESEFPRSSIKSPLEAEETSKLLAPASTQPTNVLEKVQKMEQLMEEEKTNNEQSKDRKLAKTPVRLKSNLTSKGSEISLSPINKDVPDSPLQSQPPTPISRVQHSRNFSELDLGSRQASKVSNLTKYYNEMNLNKLSQEFKERRERELIEKKNKNIRVFPIVASKPIVEIYNKIEDVVDVNDEYPDLRRLKRAGQSSFSKNPPNISKPKSQEQHDRTTSWQPPLPKSQPLTEHQPETIIQQSKSQTMPEVPKFKKAEKENLNKQLDKEVSKEKLDIPQPEKNSLLKSLTNFWADRSATLWDPLEYPLESNEHTFADSDVIVREDEPSSLVAFCLSSNDYKQKIKTMAENKEISGNNAKEEANEGNQDGEGDRNDNEQEDPENIHPSSSQGGGNTNSNATGNPLVKEDKNNENIETNELNNKKNSNFLKIEKKFKKKIGNNDNVINELEQIMTKSKSTHLKYQYLDGNTNLSCKIFYSEQFEAFRKSCGADEFFIQSLSRCVKWNSSGGKSGSNFLKTLDNRYIVKELLKLELESFVSIAPFYFKYISQSMFNTLTTAIAKIFGFYQIHIKNTISGKTFRMDFLIMENLFYNHKTTRIFDLKGSMRNRHVQQTGKENEVLLDENMIEYIYESPLFVKEYLKKLLRGSLFNDTAFLSAMDVMDYSLVIGIDDSLKKIYIGIIDWLRTFTWDKKVENWVKGNSLVGGGKKGKDPTIVTPKQYRIRFREAMERYILEVPDIWYEGNQ